MSEDLRGAPDQAGAAPSPSAGHPRSRRILQLGIVVLASVASLGLALSYAPRYVARYLVTSELEELGIEHEGVDTLTIDPWTRELWVGPVRFGAGPTGRGQLGELGLTLRFNPLLQRRVSIERLLVRGIDVLVTRGLDNALALNGIPLHRLVLPSDSTGQPEDQGDAWGAGVDNLELRESRLIFQDRERGELEVEVERLALKDFRTWQSEQPIRFELAARLNDVQLSWSGEARPVADRITLAVDSRTRQVDVPKVVRFTGPWGLDRRAGTYDAELKYEITVFDSGGLHGQVVGTISIDGVDYERSGAFALAIERGKLDVDVRYTLSDSGDFGLEGQLAADVDESIAALGGDTRFAADAGRVTLRGLDVVYAENGALQLNLQPDIELMGVDFSGPIEFSVDKLLDLLVLLQSLSAGVEVSTADTGLGDYSSTSITVPSSDVKIDRVQSSGESFSLRSNDGQVELGLKATTDLFNIRIAVDEKSLEVERLQSVLERLSISSGHGRLGVDVVGSSSLLAGTGSGPRGDAKIGAFEAEVSKLGVQAKSGAISLQLAAASQATGLSGLVHAAKGLPEVKLYLGALSAALSHASFDSVSGDLRWQAGGDAAVEALTADFANTREGALKFIRAEVKELQANERMEFAADTISVDGLDLYTKRSLIEAALRDRKANSGAVSAGAAAAPHPAKAPVLEATAQGIDVSRAQTLLTALGYAPGPVDGRVGPRTSAAIREFQRREGLAVNGLLSSNLLAALQSRITGATYSDAARVPAGGVTGPVNGSVRVGHLALTGNPVIRFRDDMVTPHVNIDTVFKEAQVRSLDSRGSGQRTQIRLVADVNEFTHVDLSGWVNGFGNTADLDLAAKLENLELSTYSPYVVELSGVYLESGQLDTRISARASQGALQGEIQLELDDVAFRPLSEEDAERMAGTVGMPLETAVGLLQDDQGRIALTLPLRGTLNDPEVEVESAVNKAIGGVLKMVFPPTMIASLLSGVARDTGAAFEPVEFAPGSADLDEAARRYLNDVAELYREHPKLSLKVCGRSTAQDMEPLATAAGAAESATPEKGPTDAAAAKETGDVRKSVSTAEAAQALQELAIERKSAVRRYLIKEAGTESERVTECRSIFEPSDQGKPRAELSL